MTSTPPSQPHPAPPQASQTSPSLYAAPVVAHVERSGFVESVHHGSVVAIDATGETIFAVGDVTSPMFPRSANKPIQALAMLRAGLDLDGELLALAAASHSGEAFHLDGVRRILAGAAGRPSGPAAGRTAGSATGTADTAGTLARARAEVGDVLTEQDLQNTPDLPYDEQERSAWLAAGHGPTAIAQNCSGKHAAMLATCVAAGWDRATYRDPAHPLQQLIEATLTELSGEPVTATAVDGCGAPVMAISLTGLARAFSRLAAAPAGTHEARVADAIRAHPQWLGGTHRDVTTLIRGVPGLVAKDGAEGVYAAGLADGRAIALKVADGAQRARPVLMAAALRRLGVDSDALAALADAPVLGHGEPVGSIVAVGI